MGSAVLWHRSSESSSSTFLSLPFIWPKDFYASQSDHRSTLYRRYNRYLRRCLSSRRHRPGTVNVSRQGQRTVAPEKRSASGIEDHWTAFHGSSIFSFAPVGGRQRI